MAKTLAIEILDYANALEKVGVSKEQAEAHARILAKITEDHLATKNDICARENNLDLKLAELKNELIRWVLGISFAQAAVIISCIKLMH